MKQIGIVGYNGHFGKVITKELIESFPEIHFTLLGRRKSFYEEKNVSHIFFDFNKSDLLPESDRPYFLIIDLSGPVKQSDGRLFKICANSNVPYMDMAIHNSHINILSDIRKSYPDSTALVHFGFFPGLSNLIVSEGFKLNGKKEAILINEFPVYAGGGKNVSKSLSNILDESDRQFNIIDKKIHTFKMHSDGQIFYWKGKPKKFYRWQYPEIDSFAYSNPDTILLERFFSIKPGFLNPIFTVLIRIWNSSHSMFLKSTLINLVYFSKSTLFNMLDPSLDMRLYDREKNELITLSVKSAVSFHGFVMSRFLSGLLSRELKPGLYTPEQLFSLDEILDTGEHNTYSLSFTRKRHGD